MKKQKSGIVTTAETTHNDYLLRLSISQNCELKKKDFTYQHIVTPYTMQIEYQKGVSLGKLLGNEISKFFETLQLQKDFKQVQFKLSKPINLEIEFFANGKSYKIQTRNDIQLKFSGDYAPHKFAKFLFASLLLITKERKQVDAFDIQANEKAVTMKEKSIKGETQTKRIFELCDSDISELTNLLNLN